MARALRVAYRTVPQVWERRDLERKPLDEIAVPV
jgi:hypothetical protein